MYRYFGSQIAEIRKDTALRLYGAFVAAGQVLTFWGWHVSGAANLLSDEVEPLCWPFFENCFRYRILGYDDVRHLLFLFG